LSEELSNQLKVGRILPDLSIVVPVLNEAENIEQSLKAVRALCGNSAELIVVDGGSTDGTVAIARRLADAVVTTSRGRARQMNAGAMLARGRFLLFLHVDTQLPETLSALVEQWVSNNTLWGFFPARLSGRQCAFRLIERLMSWRSRLTGIGTGDQCLFVERSLFHKLGGFAEQPLMEDIELSRRLKKYARPQVQKTPVTTDSRRWECYGIARTVLLMWRLRLAYFFGASPDALVKRYYPGQAHIQGKERLPAYRYPDSCIVQFAKLPVAGQVKTRLQPALGEQGCLALHKALVNHQIDQQLHSAVAPYELWCDSPFDSADFGSTGFGSIDGPAARWAESYFELVGERVLRFGIQQGQDLGERMVRCFIDRFRQYDYMVLIGSDCPAIDGGTVAGALDVLRKDKADVVIAPASDGGYVLIGLRKMPVDKVNQVFADIHWGTETVMDSTRRNLRRAGLKGCELATMEDIDLPSDLPALKPFQTLRRFSV
jgi:rSAM/selenodomain-associated transferase 2